MKRDYDTLNLGTFTVRMPIHLMQELENKSGLGLKYRNRSEALRSILQLGLRVDSLLEIHNDPKKKKEFEKKLAAMFQEKNVEKTLETMTDKELSAIIYIAQHLQDKKLDQLVLAVKKG